MLRSARRAELGGRPRRAVVPRAAEVVASAREAGLRYVNANSPGLGRRRKGKKSFAYFDADGRAVTDAGEASSSVPVSATTSQRMS